MGRHEPPDGFMVFLDECRRAQRLPKPDPPVEPARVQPLVAMAIGADLQIRELGADGDHV
jgi:hypothetical protein